MSLKNPVTPPGIDLGAVRLIAQRLNHYATPGPCTEVYWTEKWGTGSFGGNQNSLKIGTGRSLRKEVWHLTGGSACLSIRLLPGQRCPKRRVGVFQTPDIIAKCIMISRIAFILVLLCAAFEEFFRGSLDVILRRTFRKPCLFNLYLRVQFGPCLNVKLCASFNLLAPEFGI